MPGDFHLFAVQHVAKKIGRILNNPTVKVIGFIPRTRNKVGRIDAIKQRGELLLTQTIVEWYIRYTGYSCAHEGYRRSGARCVKQTYKLAVAGRKIKCRTFCCTE